MPSSSRQIALHDADDDEDEERGYDQQQKGLKFVDHRSSMAIRRQPLSLAAPASVLTLPPTRA